MNKEKSHQIIEFLYEILLLLLLHLPKKNRSWKLNKKGNYLTFALGHKIYRRSKCSLHQLQRAIKSPWIIIIIITYQYENNSSKTTHSIKNKATIQYGVKGHHIEWLQWALSKEGSHIKHLASKICEDSKNITVDIIVIDQADQKVAALHLPKLISHSY